MNSAEIAGVTNESSIDRAMEDVDLMPNRLNSEFSEPAENVASTCESFNILSHSEDSPEMNGDSKDHLDDEVQSLHIAEDADVDSAEEGEEVEDEEMPELIDSDGAGNQRLGKDDCTAGETSDDEEAPPGLMANHGSMLKDECKNVESVLGYVEIEQHEDDLQGQNGKGDQNQNKLQGTPSAALRRSSRTKLPISPSPNDVPSTVGRTTRSQINPEIIAKQKSFMHKYQIAVKSSMDSYVRSATSEVEHVKVEHQATKRKWEDTGGLDSVNSPHTSPVQDKKSKKLIANTPLTTKVGSHFMELQSKSFTRHDTFCWACHMDGQVLECRQCPRVFHQRCVQLQSPIPPNWVCTECGSVRNAEKHNQLDMDQLTVMLNFAMERIKSVADAQPFFKPVDTEEFPHYTEYIVSPVDISQLEEKISRKSYASTRAFLADFRWILHNCIIFNSSHSKLTSTARTLMKVCKHEMAEIDTCADCYVHAHTKRETWFLEPCQRPHLLLWAKLKGFPHWPAKAMKANKEGNVDVRFFGAHDRAWVPAKDCFLYSREMPMQLKNQRKANLIASVEEVDEHIKKLIERYGSFTYPAPRTAYNPSKEDEQLQQLIPGYKVSEYSQSSLCKSDRLGESGETESMNSDSDAGDPLDNDLTAHADLPEGDRTEDHSEGRNFLAMLQLAPRSCAEAATPRTVTPTSTSASVSPTPNQSVAPITVTKLVIPNTTSTVVVKVDTFLPTSKNSKTSRVPTPKVSSGETADDLPIRIKSASINDNSSSEATCEIIKIANPHLSSPPRRSSTSKEMLPVKTEPVENDEEDDASSITGSKTCSISLAIDNVVGNYKPPVAIKPKPEISVKSTLKSGSKPNPSKLPGSKPSTQKFRSTPKTMPNRPSSVKIMPASKTNAKTNRRLVGDDEDEELDPAMYLDPTITITLINSDEKKAVSKHVSDVASASSISSSDLQALNALGENVSITVVPKRKVGSIPTGGSRSKENEAVEQPMVIEVDPVALQKAKAPTQTAKARKSFPTKTRPTGHSSQPSVQKTSQKHAVPPMVSIPSRHLGMEIARPTTQQPPSSRIPSITVRPVTQLPASQPSIILQPGSTDTSSINAIAAAMKQTNPSSSTATSSTGNNTLTLNTMHTVGPESGFGTGGLLLTFNRTTPAFASAASATPSAAQALIQSKGDCGSLTAQLTSRTQQISEMVRNTLETLMQEMSSAGNLEATIAQLQMDLERSRSLHQQEIAEMKKTLEAQQSSAEVEKQRALSELRRQLETDKQKAIEEIKKKQWCAHCSQEAIFYCCWNTAYCDYPCQQAHWPKHMATCANANQNTEADVTEPEACSTSLDSKTLSPQKSIVAVNGSPSQSRKITSIVKTSQHASLPTDLGYTVLTSSDMSLTTSPSNTVGLRVQPITGAQ